MVQQDAYYMMHITRPENDIYISYSNEIKHPRKCHTNQNGDSLDNPAPNPYPVTTNSPNECSQPMKAYWKEAKALMQLPASVKFPANRNFTLQPRMMISDYMCYLAKIERLLFR